MKKFSVFLMTSVVVLCLMPWNASASVSVTVSGNKVTVNSTSAGSLASYVNSLSEAEKNELKVDEIEFVGKFNQEDLQSLQGYGYKTVDMSEAKFVAAAQGGGTQYSLYHSSTPASGNSGDKCIVGGTKYVSQKGYEWTEVSDPGNVTFQNSYGWTTDNVNSDEHRTSYNVNDYVKIPSGYNYYRKDAVWNEVNYPIVYDDFDNDGAKWFAWTWNDSEEGSWVEVTNGTSTTLKQKVIFARVKPEVTSNPGWDNGDIWNRTADLDVQADKVFVMTGYDNGTIVGNWQGENKTYENWSVDDLRTHKGNDNQIVMISVNGTNKFYRYAGVEWTAIDEVTAQSESTANYQSIEEPSWSESELANKTNEYGDPPAYIRFASGYKYYQKKDTGAYTWHKCSSATYDEYSDGEQVANPYIYSDASQLGTPTPEGQVAIVGGTVYEHNGTEWSTTGGGDDNDSYDYSQMKFSYWSDTIEKAVASKYADNTITSEIFNNCKKLTEVDYKAGNVTGFRNHSTDEGYAANLKVTIGKNATSIDESAFQNCTALSTLVFDKDYADGNADKLDGVTYPLELTIGNSAFQDCANLTGVEFPNRVVSIGNDAFKQAGTNADEMTVSFERRSTDKGASIDFDRDLTIGNSAFYGCTTIKTVELPIRLTTLGNDAFKLTSNLTSVSIREDIEDARLETIPSGAFQESGIKNLTVPRSVTLIEPNAFGSCYDLESVTFQKQLSTPQQPLVIKSGAFAGGDEYAYKLKDVYVDINPADRLLVCELNAFSFVSLVGQTDVTNEQCANLHFSKDYWDFYAGDWKLGVSFTQSDLNAMKDGYSDGGKYIGGVDPNKEIDGTTGKYETGSSNTEYAPANGWQQFARSTTGIDIIIPEGEFLRTYSTNTAYDFPMTTGSNPKQAVKVFRVIRFDDGYEEGDNVTSREVADSRPRFAYSKEITDNIPDATGMIMVGQADATVLSYFKPTTKTGYPTFPYNENQKEASQDRSDDNPTNLLVGTFDEVVTLNPTEPYHNGAIQYRIFGFAADKQFWRAKKGTKMVEQRAYLKLPISLFHWADESGGTSQDATSENSGTNSAAIAFVFTMEEVTGLQTIAIDSDGQMRMLDDDAFYTLQGVRVERPTGKGIYIHHGRKIVVK